MRGFEQVKGNLTGLDTKLQAAGKAGLREVGTNIFNESQNIVPYDTGALKASGRTEEKDSAKKLKITISYNTDYAIYVHEIARYFHPHGSYKYLENPFTKHSADLPRIIESSVRGII